MDTMSMKRGVSLKAPSLDSKLGGGLSGKLPEPHPAGRIKHGGPKQLLRFFLFLTYFLGICCITLTTQILATPLYLIDRDIYHAALALTKQNFGLLLVTGTQWWSPTVIRVSGDESIRGQLHRTADGRLETDFPARMVFMANHQIYTDWVYMWWSAYASRMHGYIYIILKDTLRLIPILGPGMMFYEFIFLTRKWAKDQKILSKALLRLKTRSSRSLTSGKRVLDPMWLLIFPEGTNLGKNGRSKSAAWAEKSGTPDMRHLLLPRSTGLFTCLQELQSSIDWVYDCTIAYEGIPRGQYGENLFTLRSTYFQGRPPKSVNLYWRRFPISSIPLEDSKAFEKWLHKKWLEKDELMEYFLTHDRFPSEYNTKEEDILEKTVSSQSAGYIETNVKLAHWWELTQIIAPLASLAFICNIIAKLWNFAVYGNLRGMG